MSLINKTTWLIVPMAFYGKGLKSTDILINGFVNAYIGDLHRPELDDKILLIFDDKEKVIEIPKDFKDNYWRIITSQYHEISDDYWKIVTDFWDEPVKPPLEELDDFDIFEEIYNMCM